MLKNPVITETFYYNPRIEKVKTAMIRVMEDIINNLPAYSNHERMLEGAKMIRDAIEINFQYAHDIKDLYEWMGLAIDGFNKGEYKDKLFWKDMVEIWSMKDGGLMIVDKLVTDLLELELEHKDRAATIENIVSE